MVQSLRGIDISSWNGTNIDWEWVGKTYDFCVVKCTGGMGYKNPYYAEQLRGARGAGLVVGHYHYAVESSLPVGDNPMGPGGDVEAIRFLQESDIQGGEFVALDLEDKQLPAAASEWVLSFNRMVRGATGAIPFVYSYKSFMEEFNLLEPELAEYPLWYAYYRDPEKPTPIPRTPGNWSKISMWQWSGGIDIPQMPEGRVDQNVFYGTREDLQKLGRRQMTQDEVNQSPIITPERNWGGTGVIRFHTEQILAQNVETGDYYFKSFLNGHEVDWQRVTPGER